MSIWTDNLRFLQANAGELYQRVISGKDEEDMEVTLDGGRRLVRVRRAGLDVYLGSSVNPKREAERLLAGSNERAGFVVVLGLGNLKLLDAARRRFLHITRLIIVEPSYKIFAALLKNIPLRTIFAAFPDTQITLLLDEEFERIDNLYKAFVSSNPTEESALALPVAYRQMFPLHAGRLERLLANTNLEIKGSNDTRKYFRYIWHLNEWRNLNIKSARQDILAELVAKVPVIVVGAGPSLDKNLHLLREVGDRALIMAVGSGIRIMHNNGIVPHLRVSLEAGNLQERLFAGVDPAQCPIVYNCQLSHSIARAYTGNAIEMFPYTNYELERYMLTKIGVYPVEISSGSSVASTAVFLLAALRARKVILLGQDLCGQLDKNYAKGSWATDKDNKALMNTDDRYKTTNIYGEEVYTTNNYISIKTTLEYTAQVYNNIHFINATEGGLNIAGFENKRLLEVLAEDLPGKAPLDIRAWLQEAIARDIKAKPWQPDNMRKACQAYLEDLRNLSGELQKVADWAADGLNDKKAGRVKRQLEKISDMPTYSIVSTGFSLEYRAVTESFWEKDLTKRQRALACFVREMEDFIAFSAELGQEFLTGEEKLKAVFQG